MNAIQRMDRARERQPSATARSPCWSGARLTIDRGADASRSIGRSGSGKSTLLRLIGGLEAADTGVVRVDGDGSNDADRDRASAPAAAGISASSFSRST